MSGALQAVFQNQRSFGIAIGNAYQGGFFAGQISTAGNGIANYNLVIAPFSTGQTFAKWKTTNTATTGTSSVIDGPNNSSAMDDADHPCAQFCEALSIGGFSDWYMPAKNELEVCYFNLKPNVNDNNPDSGANTNAVPSRGSNYGAQNPAVTSATDFKNGGSQQFTAGFYWCSTESSTTNAFVQSFNNGEQAEGGKAANRYVRAIRRVAV